MTESSDLFGYRGLTFVQSVAESKKINLSKEPCIIIASSGMCENGRILHHLRHNIENSNTAIVIVGFTAKETLGRKIAERQPVVKILDEEFSLRAEVAVLHSFSAHADRQDLINYAKSTAATLKGVFVVHGEEEQSISLANALAKEGISRVSVPLVGDTVTF